MPATELTLEEDLVDGVVVIAATGEIDRATAPELSGALRSATLEHAGPLLVDLCEVSFIDSAGISVLLNAHLRLLRQGRQLYLACPPSAVRRIFEITGLDETLSIYPTREAAMAGCS